LDEIGRDAGGQLADVGDLALGQQRNKGVFIGLQGEPWSENNCC